MPQSLEDLVEQYEEEGLSKEEAIKAAKKRFLQETKVKSKPRMQVADKKSYNDLIKKELKKQQEKNKNKKNIKIKNLKVKTIKTKEGGSIGEKLVASFYGGLIGK